MPSNPGPEKGGGARPPGAMPGAPKVNRYKKGPKEILFQF